MISSIFSTALQGLQLNQQAFQRYAHAISLVGTVEPDGYDLPGNIVGLMTAQRGFEANLAVLDRADEMIGSLLDVLA